MRLLNTQTLELQESWDNAIPPYAILSHTWEKNEVTFQEVQTPTQEVKEKEGYQKVKRCCEIAAQDGFEWAWVDTCCIDKTSSSELSEAINSMFKWYKRADVCYVYLCDYTFGHNLGVPDHSFGKCRWFTRGWTLQELIAPRDIIFFNNRWEDIGTKASLCEHLAGITGIPIEALRRFATYSYSAAQRMSWAAKRQTTREEDLAYCLLGIFEVNMPLMYGEGMNAFHRLQTTIMSWFSDRSLFAFGSPGDTRPGERALFAYHPIEFTACHDIFRESAYDEDHVLGPIIDTENGTILELLTSPISEAKFGKPQTVTALLNCRKSRFRCRYLALKLEYRSDNNSDRTSGRWVVLDPELVELDPDMNRDGFEIQHLYVIRMISDSYRSDRIFKEPPIEVEFSLSNLPSLLVRRISGQIVREQTDIVAFGVTNTFPMKCSLLLIHTDQTLCVVHLEVRCRPGRANSTQTLSIDELSERAASVVVEEASDVEYYDVRWTWSLSDRAFWKPTHGKWGLTFVMKRKRANGHPIIHVTISETEINDKENPELREDGEGRMDVA